MDSSTLVNANGEFPLLGGKQELSEIHTSETSLFWD